MKALSIQDSHIVGGSANIEHPTEIVHWARMVPSNRIQLAPSYSRRSPPSARCRSALLTIVCLAVCLRLDLNASSVDGANVDGLAASGLPIIMLPWISSPEEFADLEVRGDYDGKPLAPTYDYDGGLRWLSNWAKTNTSALHIESRCLGSDSAQSTALTDSRTKSHAVNQDIPQLQSPLQARLQARRDARVCETLCDLKFEREAAVARGLDAMADCFREARDDMVIETTFRGNLTIAGVCRPELVIDDYWVQKHSLGRIGFVLGQTVPWNVTGVTFSFKLAEFMTRHPLFEPVYLGSCDSPLQQVYIHKFTRVPEIGPIDAATYDCLAEVPRDSSMPPHLIRNSTSATYFIVYDRITDTYDLTFKLDIIRGSHEHFMEDMEPGEYMLEIIDRPPDREPLGDPRKCSAVFFAPEPPRIELQAVHRRQGLKKTHCLLAHLASAAQTLFEQQTAS